MKKLQYLSALFFIIIATNLYKACEACDLKQPKITRGFTHGAGPQSFWDWVAVGIIVIISVLTVLYFIKYSLKSDYKKSNHIKNSILNF
ncbi:MAG: hypothetical protein JST62_01835 [Bacteroidetes bacterium]|jgi:hypothetical protein|nr:hypothetical protein [Bacteroidota bacterium]